MKNAIKILTLMGALSFTICGAVMASEQAAGAAAKPLIIGHRGASAYAPENTMASFKKAHELAADMIELDIHRSMDGELFVIHDDDTKRTTGTPGLIKLMSSSEIKTLDAGSWFGEEFAGEKIPTLEEVMEWAKGKIQINIEIKSEGCEEKTVALLKKYDMVSDVIVSSFHHEYLKKTNELNPDVVTAALVRDIEGAGDLKKVIEDCAPEAVNPRYLLLNKKAVSMAHKAGLKVYPYTVNDPISMKRMLSAGADGVITNNPDILRELIYGREEK